MAIKFRIKETMDKAEVEGNMVVRFSGTGEKFRRQSERAVKKIGGTEKEPLLKFTTGLEEDQVQFYNWYNEDEKKVIKKAIKDLKPLIADFYGGKEALEPTNQSFWRDDRLVNKVTITYENNNVLLDTSKAENALLYLSVIGGAFIETVAPNKDFAETNQIPHYLALEVEDNNDFTDEDDITKSEAHGALTLLRKEYGRDALYILAWCLMYDTNAFGAFRNSTSEKDLINSLIKYIDGKLVTKRKRNTPKTFIEYYDKWTSQQTRPLLYTEAYIKAGEYYNFITQREKKFVTYDGTILGNTIKEAVDNIMTPKFNVDYEKLRDQVEGKWKE